MNEIAYRKPAKREFVPKQKPKPYEILHQDVGGGKPYKEKPYMSKPKSEGNWYKNESANMNRKLIRLTESDLHRIVKESVNRILKESDYVPSGYADKDGEIYRNPKNGHVKRVKIGSKYENKPNKVGDYVSSGYADKNGRIFRNPKNGHVKRVNESFVSSNNYSLCEIDETKEFAHDEIMKLVEILKQNPIEERWKPYDLGFCKVQRVEANQVSGRTYLLNAPKQYDPNMPEDLYSDGNSGEIFLQIGRLPNTHWLDDSGYTYMCWK